MMIHYLNSKKKSHASVVDGKPTEKSTVTLDNVRTNTNSAPTQLVQREGDEVN